jgi:MFS family permease
MEFLDELYSGVPSIGAPAIQSNFAASYQLTAWALLLIPGIVGFVVEPFLFLLADRHPRAWFIRGGALAMAATAFAAAAAPSIHVVTVATAFAYVAGGCAVSMAQATLVDAHPDERERILTRWAMLGVVGDLAGPALFAGLAAAALGWRAAYAIVGALVAVWAVGLCRTRFAARAAGGATDPETGAAETADEPLLSSLWLAVRNRRLVWWLLGCALCDLLDEILVVFASLHLRDVFGAGELARSAVLGGFVAGSAVGLAVTERLLHRVAPLRLLAVASASCAALYLVWLATPVLWLSALLLVLVGAAAAPLYPIAMAQAYAALPDRSGAVQAAAHMFSPLMMVVPWLLGWIADRHGTGAALVALLVQPVGILLLTLVTIRRSRRT